MHYFVGGATKLYGAALYRLRKEDFGELRHHDGISPAWPVSYDEFEPYYTQAEQLYQVHGARGEDPTEPHASGPYPFPAVSHEPRIQQLADDLAAAATTRSTRPAACCSTRRTCPTAPACAAGPATASRAWCTPSRTPTCSRVRPALEHPNVTLVRNAQAVALHTNDAGTAVTEVEADVDGRRERFTADIVVVSCGAANSAKLLLSSATERHPNGLANGSDQLGRNYTFHNSQAVLALSKEPNPTVFQKTLGLNDFYFGSDDFEFPLGNIQMVGKSQADMYRGEKPLETKLAPERTLDRIATHAVDFWLSTEDLPRPENRVTLGTDGNIQLTYRQTNQESAKPPVPQAQGPARAHRHGVGSPDPAPRLPEDRRSRSRACAHQAGTCRFGSDPASSVLDTNCRAHELDNLYVVDTSFFPSIGAVNPALTAMANALRVGDHLLERLGAATTKEPATNVS